MSLPDNIDIPVASLRSRCEGSGESDPEEMEPIGAKMFETGSLTPERAEFFAETEVSKLDVADYQLDEREVRVRYDASDVLLTVNCEQEDIVSISAGVDLSADEARQLAEALFQAAEEKEQRPIEQGRADD